MVVVAVQKTFKKGSKSLKIATEFYLKMENIDKTLKEQRDGLHNQI